MSADITFQGAVLVTDLDNDLNTLIAEGQGATVSTVPEPATLLLLGSGVAGVLARRRRNTQAS